MPETGAKREVDPLDLMVLLKSLKAFKKGDFKTRLPDDWPGVAGEIAEAFNDVVSNNEDMAREFALLVKTVGSKGKVRERAKVGPLTGGWADCMNSVNTLMDDLVRPISEVGEVIGAVAKGDLTRIMELEVEGEPRKGAFLHTAKTVNSMVERLGSFADEVTRVAREVGTEGKLGGQANVRGLSGTWRDLTGSVNMMANNLTNQVRNIAEVTTAVANGDLSKEITVAAEGEILDLKKTINTMVEQLNSFASEVTRVAKAVGTDGKLGDQAEVPDVSGIWKDLTDNVNTMASNLTNQVRNIAEVTTAVANGDLGKKITVEASGEILELGNTINTMVDQLSSFADEVTRVAREVGTEGKLGGQAQVEGASGTWKDLTDNVNTMASNLTSQVRNIAEVTTAVANGDLSKKITVEASGEILELGNTINTMVDQLSSFAAEVTRVAREVGTEGKLGGQAQVEGVSGTWKELTDNVNTMASNLTSQVRNIAEVTTAVANGDLGKKITVEASGEILELGNTINTMVDQLSSFADEVTRVAREVGTEGELGGQAKVEGVSGTWKDLTDNVNMMANNLTEQVRNIAEVTTAVAFGDLSKKITVEASGEILELRNTINTMVDQLSSFADEVTRVSREVGIDGILGGQAAVEGVSGTWKELTDNVNMMANNLTNQVRNIAEVTTAVANGDLTKQITVDASGEILELRNTINKMVDQLSSFADEVTRVAREVGTEGELGGQAKVEGVSGTWKDLTDNVNTMAKNLTEQVRNIAEVTTAVAKGDLSKHITVEASGEILELRNTINTMVDQLSSFADEVTRVAREVGTDGKLGGQAQVQGVSGTWKELTDNVNTMANNLTEQVRNIAEVTTAVAKGNLTKQITVEASGEILELRNTINTMVDQLSSFADEVTRVAREVGTDGKLGGQAKVEGVSGTWKDLTDNVNMMANNLTEQVRNIAEVTTAVANGDLSKKITVEARGEIMRLRNTINGMVDQLSSFASEVTRVAREVGNEGRLGGQASVEGVSGTWKDLTDNTNMMANNLTEQVRNIAEVTTAVANGDFSKKITVDVRGEILELRNTINTMVDQLSSFASEVTRVAREVGTEGKLGGQAEVAGVSGTWKDLTDNVNIMADNLTNQVRGIAKVVTAVANGDLKRKLTLDAKGEIAELAETINEMTDTLATFADQVTNVAREVGIEGKLGSQARVPGAAGIWRDLTDNVNELAANLTTQVRNISEVATAVTEGDLTRSITAETRGEIAELKDNVNEMIRNLRETTRVNTEQDWLKTNLARFAGMLQGQRELLTVGNRILSELAPLVNAQHGLFYMVEQLDDEFVMKLLASYAYKERKHLSNVFRSGEGLIGQVAMEKKRILIGEVPDNYVKINSGLGEGTPLNLVVLPVLFEGELQAIIELASFNRFNEISLTFLDQLTESIGIMLNTIAATMRTEDLLKESQSMAEELQNQQEELKQTNEELEEKARELSQQKEEVERKNSEVELAKESLEEKAEELALTSKYKSEFLANMSHELRTPLNSQLILSKLLADNSGENLSQKQVEYAETIHTSGQELLGLINEILDLSKIESGTMSVDLMDWSFSEIKNWADRSFGQTAAKKDLDFVIALAKNLPRGIRTDQKRLQQVLKNLLSNAFKFTEKGKVQVDILKAKKGWHRENDSLNNAHSVIAFQVSDTGIGIPKDKQKVVFEAFQQADGTTSRKFGGTGLGLSISREIARLLGGEIRVESAPGEGSIFTLYLPQQAVANDVDPENDPPKNSQWEIKKSQVNTDTPVTRDHKAQDPVALLAVNELNDDRDRIKNDDRVALIIEDDRKFAPIVMDVARERGFKVLAALRGDTALALAQTYKPHAITLDLELPDMDGLTILDRLKHHPATRHIPVHIISVNEDEDRKGMKLGAIAHLQKPVTKKSLEEAFGKIEGFVERKIKQLLVVEDDEVQRNAIKELVGNGDVMTTAVESAEEALKALRKERFDCMVLDLRLPSMSGFKLLGEIKKDPGIDEFPIIIYTGKDLTEKEETELRLVSQSIIVKDVRSMERLLHETTLFLHRIEERLPEKKRELLKKAHLKDPHLAGKKILVVDDDVRNIFALTSMLEQYNMEVFFAETGIEGLERLENNPNIQVVLMDIMMPGMDGYETMREIRKRKQFKSLPIIALTAKAMKGDREKCIEAGASDYISKPVNNDQLISLLRVWLYK